MYIPLVNSTYCCSFIDQLPFLNKQFMKCFIGQGHHLETHIPEDVKLTGQSSVVCREAATNQGSTRVAAQWRDPSCTASAEVEFDKTTHTIARKSKLCVLSVSIKKGGSSFKNCNSLSQLFNGTDDNGDVCLIYVVLYGSQHTHSGICILTTKKHPCCIAKGCDNVDSYLSDIDVACVVIYHKVVGNRFDK